MKSFRNHLLLLFLISSLSTCHTAHSIRHYNPDFSNYSLFFSGTVSIFSSKPNTHVPFVGILVFLDLPFSFLMDLILSPVTTAVTVWQHFRLHEPDGDLFIHIKKNELNELSAKLDSGRSPNTRLKTDGTSLLAYSASKEKHLAVKLLLEKKADLRTEDNAGNTPLETAILSRSPESYHLLMKSGADFTIHSHRPVFLAVSTGTEEIAADLLKRIPNAGRLLDRDYEGILACAGGTGILKKVKLLMESGADINRPDKAGRLLLHRLSVSQPGTEEFETLQYILSKGADPKASEIFEGKKRNALETALGAGAQDAAELLKKYGAR